VDRLAGVPRTRRISRLSCGQRSQVTLGLILAQRADLLILDDYSLGLDVGYRRLFLEFLRDFVDRNATTVLLTSHIVAELENVLDEIVILQEGSVAAKGKKDEFMGTFYQYRLPLPAADLLPAGGEGPVLRLERGKNALSLFSHCPPADMRAWLAARGLPPEDTEGLEPTPMNFEDAFVGLTGRY
jgi:ABC-2 type transport system ATP-binding protein